MKIFFINNNGGGFSGPVEAPEGTTISAFFKMQMGEEAGIGNYAITVNKLETHAERVLVDGDTVTIVPSKYSGA